MRILYDPNEADFEVFSNHQTIITSITATTTTAYTSSTEGAYTAKTTTTIPVTTTFTEDAYTAKTTNTLPVTTSSNSAFTTVYTTIPYGCEDSQCNLCKDGFWNPTEKGCESKMILLTLPK